MAEESDTNRPVLSAEWARDLYRIAQSDTRWAKEQGWKVVNWCLLLFGALLGIQRFRPELEFCVFVVADLFVVSVAIFYLVDLHLWASKLRQTTKKIEKGIEGARDTLHFRSIDVNHVIYLVFQLLIVTGCLAFILIVQWYGRHA